MRKAIPILSMLFMSASLYADVTVTGRVIDESGEPMIGVNVLL